jgi:UDP-N-acetyl-D-galactosamine dehydrogenase
MEYKIAVIGLGYVGIPLAVEFGKKYTTIGLDINLERIEELKRGLLI